MPPDAHAPMPSMQSDRDMASGRLVEIRTTCPSREVAESLAGRLVQARLAACVQIDGPVRSTYEWRGALETADEWRCTCKTTAARAAACANAIAMGHPYETPEIITAAIEASEAYAAWVRSSVSGTSGGGG